MKLSSLLLVLVLAFGALAGGPTAAAANPLDGKVFQSVEKLPGSERRDGSFDLIHWKISFKGESFEWRRSDTISVGTYKIDAKTGAVVIKDSDLKASFDAKTGVLTWGKQKYKVPKDEK